MLRLPIGDDEKKQDTINVPKMQINKQQTLQNNNRVHLLHDNNKKMNAKHRSSCEPKYRIRKFGSVCKMDAFIDVSYVPSSLSRNIFFSLPSGTNFGRNISNGYVNMHIHLVIFQCFSLHY